MGCRELQYYFRDGVSSDYHRASGTIPNRFAFRFSSEYHDSETGLVYYNYRYYSPELGRWLSRDPIGENGGYNLYAMVGNDPVNYWDIWDLDGTTKKVLKVEKNKCEIIIIVGSYIRKFHPDIKLPLRFYIRKGSAKQGKGVYQLWYEETKAGKKAGGNKGFASEIAKKLIKQFVKDFVLDHTTP